MFEVKTVADAEALVGQTLGMREDQRVITRIINLRTSSGSQKVLGHVYWKRPGGKERSIGKSLQTYLAWARKPPRQPIHSTGEVEEFLGLIPEGELKGFISRMGNKVTISFEVL